MKFGGTTKNASTPSPSLESDDVPTTSYQSFTEIASPALRNLLFTSRHDDVEGCPSDDPLAPPSSVFGWRSPRTNSSGSSVNHPSDHQEEIDFRGFSTSISDMFADMAHERTDCCAITCCGIVQNDRDRFLVTGVAPPSVIKRIMMHFVIPIALFLTAGICAMRIRNIQVNQMASTGLIVMMLYYFTLQCAKGRAKRSEVRKDLLFVKHQMVQQDLLKTRVSSRLHRQRAAIMFNNERPEDSKDDNDGDEREYFLGQTQRDMRCAHPCCLVGFYPEDRPVGRRTRGDSFCSNLYELMCPDFCGVHCQLCGMCAIAQEARELERTILPPPYRRVDYITMEPVLHYYPAIYEHRHRNAASQEDVSTLTLQKKRRFALLLGQPLSRLSHGLARAFIACMGILLIWSVVGPYYWQKVLGKRASINTFQICHFMILTLTLLQSAGFMAVSRYLVDRYEPCQLSLDAMIKFLASGFFLSASMAIFWELILSQTIDVFVSLLLAVIGITAVENPEMDIPNMVSRRNGIDSSSSLSNYGASIGKTEYATVFGLDHPLLFTLYLLMATYIVTALVEEICKYFGFIMVEHPDFMSRQELKEAARILRKDDSAVLSEDGDEEEASRSQSLRGVDFRCQGQSIQAQGGAITMAMVSVAVGFTCCENLLYIFLYSGKTFGQELGVLIERTFFPLHLVLAAIQSIGMCQRLLEGDLNMKIGFVIRPSVLIHGTFDFLILFISFMGKVLGQQYEAGDLMVSNTAEFLSLFMSVAVMGGAYVYLAKESTRQRERLANADLQTYVDKSRLI